MASLPQSKDINANISAQPLAAGIVGIMLSALFFFGRAASRWITKQRFDASDYTLLLGMICCWGSCAMVIYGKCLLSWLALAIVFMAQEWLGDIILTPRSIGTTQGLGRRLAAIAQTDPTLAGPERIMKVSTRFAVFHELSEIYT